ncbi:ABC transporter substrate-binding protein [Thalassospira lucentensis]|uniref:ABC transporter substrate-binding protein n=1 Tax=Thalassospira lucentensis TaxID=168935 RepID=UPI0020CA8467|nr:ABC transporter substrate-binding protein [Thalassospira lucentensis]
MISLIKRNTFALTVGVITAGAISCSTPAQATDYPLQMENCGNSLTFDAAPDRVVSIGQSSTEILYLLGLADKVVGTAVWLGPVLNEFKDVNANIPRLADDDPSFESVVGTKPQLVTTQFQWHVGPKGAVGTIAQFNEFSIPVYTSPADCKGKDNSTGGDGTRSDAFSMAMIYQEIGDLAKIFDVEARGDALIADLKAREKAAREKVAGIADGDVSAVIWFSSAELDIDPYVAGKKGAPGYIMSILGVENVITSNEEWPTVGWETVARANPDIIVIGKMDRRRYQADDWELKLDFLKNDPVTRQMKAVKQGHIVVMDAQAMNPTIRTIDGIETLADAVEKFGMVRQ